MNITTITRFHYPEDKKDTDEYQWRLHHFGYKVLPRLEVQDADVNVWCNEWQREELESLGVSTFSVDTVSRKNELGYFVDFADWEDVEGLEKYDVQIGVDSDDLLEPSFVPKVKEICSQKDSSTHISFQPTKCDVLTREEAEMDRTYNDQGSPIFAIYQPNKDNYKFAYKVSHLDLPQLFENQVFVEGHCYQAVHQYNDSTSL